MVYGPKMLKTTALDEGMSVQRGTPVEHYLMTILTFSLLRFSRFFCFLFLQQRLVMQECSDTEL